MTATTITQANLIRMVVYAIGQQLKLGSTHVKCVEFEYPLANPLSEVDLKDLERIVKACHGSNRIKSADPSQKVCQITGVCRLTIHVRFHLPHDQSPPS